MEKCFSSLFSLKKEILKGIMIKKQNFLFLVLILSIFILSFSSFNSTNTISLKDNNEIETYSILSSGAIAIFW